MLPASWRMDLVQADATFPDIPLGAEVVSNAPHYEVAVDPLTPEGRQVGFALEWHSVDASGVTEPFFLAIGGPWCATHDALDVPQPIQDYQTTTSRVTILAGQVISDVHIPMDVSHTYIGDLTIDVTSPAGTTVRLHDRSGGGSANIVGTYGEDLTPAEPLSAFTGETSHGRWRLDVTDHAGSDSGTLNGWGVEICDEPEPPPTPEILLRGVSVERNGVLVRWWPYPGLESYRVYRAEAPDSVAGFVNVTAEDDDDTDEQFLDLSTVPLAYYLVTGVGPQGEGPLGHYGQ
jgi:subtilisin-like proprotein convertase family protein